MSKSWRRERTDRGQSRRTERHERTSRQVPLDLTSLEQDDNVEEPWSDSYTYPEAERAEAQ